MSVRTFGHEGSLSLLFPPTRGELVEPSREGKHGAFSRDGRSGERVIPLIAGIIRPGG